MKIKRFIAASLLGTLMLAGLSANASTVTFIFGGTVLSCNNAGIDPCGTSLFAGDSVGGSLDVDSAALVPGEQVDASEIAGYSFDFGPDLSFNTGNSNIDQSFIGVDAFGELDGGALVISATMLIPGSDTNTLTLNFGSSFWTIFADVNGVSTLVANGVGKLTIIPVPGALLMFAPALLGFLGLRRAAA